ncbi:threonine ammonia-lyase [Haloferax mediterranei ATCC 33500]|uniref:threonine ammonia-lyase n=1 Tax=Haloferax mediterranei (strain ATCC 33500 / DSM 1411 / JCM 8866 / NBRC 14739 / NCIMB 2177 / R-4) TaxID=523841 RepID=I3R1Q5_HALMT|nr:threonine ammonia-lyase [Haloferax mediterranei]AFK18165.1 threonine ammonia-lyase [Haloferax mediterranei ATCC 33500]AHZ22427.1 threonine dehydratase [Haloferax mediterranei ATCC 33500]EMA02561.1 threonine ammonia-lyase [Haloferax mediterranei ATCC 33500]MDX5988256.1 threonine ammonia-lyase [Haloferax mediterranei ATCC 33500]QCQ74696.1 threonine ammonia-lyase [Haloferax mediterranei ATCC 33500]
MLSLADIHAARERVETVARWTSLEYSHTFSDITGAEVHLKLENSQRTGSFKIRGATNRITTLSEEEKDAGVVTASAGNHAQGVALAATRAGVDSKIVMPEHAPISKVKATERYGGNVVLHGTDYDEAQAKAHEIEEEEGRTYVHAFDDEYVMAGQGTIGLEILEDCPDLDTVVVPIGGGGLISGIATAIKEQHPDVRVIGVQAEEASSAADSLDKGSIQTLDEADTIADGIAVRQIGGKTFEVIQEHVDEVVTVSDEEIAVALTYLLERSKTLVEGAGAVALAALVFEKFDYEADEVIVPTLSGGNIDMNTLTTVLMRGLVETGRYLKVRTELKDRPGSLEQLIEIIAEKKANIYAVRHDRTSRKIALNATEVELDLEMRGSEHVEELLSALRDEGYEVEVLD